MSSNLLEGRIPPSLSNCSSLLILDLSSNHLTHDVPSELGSLSKLVMLYLGINNLTGQFPASLGNLTSLQELDFGYNRMEGEIPDDVARLTQMVIFQISLNSFSGVFPPGVYNMSLLKYLSLPGNSFSGNLRDDFGDRLPNLRRLLLGINQFTGAIPITLPNISSLERFDTSDNHLTGSIPLGFGKLPNLWWLGIQYNSLGNNSSTDLEFLSNFGNVFKGLLGPENKLVAVKVLNLLKHGSMKSFLAECEAFKGIRHRNLVKLITVCSSLDSKGNEFRALVYEFMPKGSLDMWLQPEDLERANNQPRTLTLPEKLNIAIDVASALEYLHVHCHDPVAHCDLKPSNILLDDDLTAHVSDFGLARLLYKFDRESFLNMFSSAGVRGTIGYAAPEYGMGGQPSIQGDVYSFGVLLLEMFTGKNPTDESFAGDYNLHSYTKSVLSVNEETGGSKAIDEGVRLVLQVGIRCSEEHPRDRMRMAEALRELFSIRSKFFGSNTTIRVNPSG
ncbi:hypothetical protein AALP_AA8G227000 [Arabis alpina]|uniref:non-specific serine/threonine protein kinase n=1 Tax=Arabis alpina TaxID=50452 RepID=A0A087G8T0_ARAAL|nr:hypothetical protein AALP_AA8G227000 [Arabis alpina]